MGRLTKWQTFIAIVGALAFMIGALELVTYITRLLIRG
jgi:hypothetical protein